jgi:hypothetical protein
MEKKREITKEDIGFEKVWPPGVVLDLHTDLRT